MDDRFVRLRAKYRKWYGWYKDLRPVRAVYWYMDRRGALLCGGIAYTALFSLFAGLTIGFSVFSVTLSSRPQLEQAVFDSIDAWVPGLIGTGENAVVSPEELIRTTVWTPATIIAAVVLLYTAIAFMRALRVSVRSMFDRPVVGVSPVLSKLWELCGFVILGGMVVASAAAGIIAQTFNRRVEDVLGTSAPVRLLLTSGTVAVGILLDALLVYLIIRVVARVRPRRVRDVWIGCIVAGVVAGALRWAGTAVIASTASRNVLLASFATLVTVLVLVNFVARVLLLVCAWIYDPPRLDEIARAESEVRGRREAAEIDRVVRRGQGSGKPWSPVVRGVRRGSYGVVAAWRPVDDVRVRTRG